ncbi:MAG TPA: hypothetical protein VMC61_03865 [Methanocella sp.]|nr:hypothetical protein [Methanocella sp.]
MDILTIILIMAAIVVLILVGGGIFAYFAFAVPAMKAAPPLSEEDRAVCRELIKGWKAYPFLCRSSVKKRCLPLPAVPEAELGESEVGP